ncbi:MAG: LPS-assembly protein LptD [Bacteroidales bacterium]|nr:LPS-assembly protein LptD [Bacteroidales bacterium]
MLIFSCGMAGCFDICSAQNSDSIAPERGFTLSKNALKEKIRYEASDSVMMDLKGKKAHLFHDTKVKYEDVELTSDQIRIDFDSNMVYAEGTADSNGILQGKPIFTQKETRFFADGIKYQFQTKQGVVYHVITQEGDGIIHGSKIKKVNDSVTFLQRGVYTTCDLEHPHYGFVFTKAKMVKDNVIVTKFIRPEIRDIPIPIGLPFSILPNTKGHKNGILLPTYGESAELGFFLQGLGFYYYFNECLDLTLSTDLYLRGSFAVNAKTNYYRRYKYRGYLNASYSLTRRGEAKTPTYYNQQDFRLTWKHNQDSKAHPRNRFSADVNYQTSAYNKNNITDINNYVNSNYQSSVSFSTSWGNLYSLGINADLSQNVSTGVIRLNMPNINWNISTFYPFRRKEIVGKIRWYENISVSYNAIVSNSVQTTDSLFMRPEMFRQMSSGVSHSIPVSSTLKLLKNFDWNNTVSFNEYWQFKGAYRHYDGTDSLQRAIITRDTVYGFFPLHRLSYTSTLRTTLYGMFQFRTPHLKAMRHEVTPSVSFNYTPFISQGSYFSYYDSTQKKEVSYAAVEGFLYGVPADRTSATATFSIGNKLEMKVKKNKDTTDNLQKITLLESFNISTSYNFMADSMNWTPVSISGRTSLFKKIFISFSCYLDPYVINGEGRRTNRLEWEANHRLFRLSSTAASLSFEYRLNNSNFRKDPIPSTFGGWDLSFSYSLNYNLSDNYNYYHLLFFESNRYNQTFTNTVNLNGNVRLTKKWSMGFSSGYDFTNKAISTSSLNFNRDLHCWVMSFQWRPVGYYRGFSFTVNAKSSMLQDLKYDKKKDFRNNR